MRKDNSFLNQVLSKIVKIAFLGAVLLGAGQARLQLLRFVGKALMAEE